MNHDIQLCRECGDTIPRRAPLSDFCSEHCANACREWLRWVEYHHGDDCFDERYFGTARAEAYKFLDEWSNAPATLGNRPQPKRENESE